MRDPTCKSPHALGALAHFEIGRQDESETLAKSQSKEVELEIAL